MTNGGASAWAAASICSTIVLALGGAFGSSYIRDQNRMEAAIRVLQEQRDALAYTRGITEQRLDQLSDRAATNTEDIGSGLSALDTALQREMRLLDSAVQVQLDNLDRRIQSEVKTLFQAQASRVDALRAWIDGPGQGLWTTDDQRRFEDQLGIHTEIR